jgi:ketosteroid isomerase-like protein
MKRIAMKISFTFLFFLTILYFSCGRKNEINTGKEKAAMKQADIDFSNLSKAKGMKEAFLKYMDTAAVLLKPGRSPLKGMDAAQLIYNTNDSSFILTWAPQGAEISSSGDLGYTYGIWTICQKKWLSDSVTQGTYVTIWKKQANGGWKFVLDTGNEGIEKKK